MPTCAAEQVHVAVSFLENHQVVVAKRPVENVLPGSFACFRDGHLLHGRVPTQTSDYTAPVRTTADQYHTVGGMLLAHKLPNVEHSRGGHIGSACIPNVRIVLPDDGFRVWPVMLDQAVERFDHRRLPQIPATRTRFPHNPTLTFA